MKCWCRWLAVLCLCLIQGVIAPPVRAATPGSGLRVLATTFPVWLFIRGVTRDVPGVSVELMIPASAGCPHDYALSPADMMRLAAADVLIVNGLGLETFLGASPDAVRGRLKEGAVVLAAADGVSSPLSYPGEGPEAVNPHVFASPRLAADIVERLAEGLSARDPEHAGLYRANARGYAGQLRDLADEYTALRGRLCRTHVVVQHADLDYLARDAGLSVEAVVQPHEGQEPSAARMLELVRLIREKEVGAILTEPQYPAASGETLARESGVPVAQLDSVASGPADAGPDYYIQVMDGNLQTLERILGCR